MIFFTISSTVPRASANLHRFVLQPIHSGIEHDVVFASSHSVTLGGLTRTVNWAAPWLFFGSESLKPKTSGPKLRELMAQKHQNGGRKSADIAWLHEGAERVDQPPNSSDDSGKWKAQE
jgi:hypothetical protein